MKSSKKGKQPKSKVEAKTKSATKPPFAPTGDAPPKPPKRKRASSGGGMSALDAAANVLKDHGKPMTCGEMIEAMLKQGLWTTKGKTPASTLYSAILRQIQTKGKEAPFRKVERGKFTLAK